MKNTYNFEGGTVTLDVNDDWTGYALLEWSFKDGPVEKLRIYAPILKAIFRVEGAKLLQAGLDQLLASLEDVPS